MRRKHYELVCPVQVTDDGDLCSATVEVWVTPEWATPEQKGSRDEPPTGASIDAVKTDCGHQKVLENGDYDNDLFEQLTDKEDY